MSMLTLLLSLLLTGPPRRPVPCPLPAPPAYADSLLRAHFTDESLHYRSYFPDTATARQRVRFVQFPSVYFDPATVAQFELNTDARCFMRLDKTSYAGFVSDQDRPLRAVFSSYNNRGNNQGRRDVHLAGLNEDAAALYRRYRAHAATFCSWRGYCAYFTARGRMRLLVQVAERRTRWMSQRRYFRHYYQGGLANWKNEVRHGRSW